MNVLKKKNDLTICCPQEIHFNFNDMHQLKVKRWKKIFHANSNQKRTEVATVVSHIIHFQTKSITRDKEGYYILIKGSIITSIYAPYIGASNI